MATQILFLRPLIMILAAVLSFASAAFAGSSQGLTYQGRILRSASEPMNSGTAVFSIKILDANNNCTLWQETQSVAMTDSLGAFAVNIGTAANTAAGALTLSQVFTNAGTLSGLTCADGATTYAPAATHDRNLSVTFVDSETGTRVAMSATPMAIKAAPFALQADQVSGYGILNLAKISGVGSANSMTGTQFDFLTNLAAVASVSATPCGNNEVLKYAGGVWGCSPIAVGTASTSTLTAATSTNSIDNANFAQTWNWTTATTQSPLSIAADAITTGSLMNLTTSSAAVNSTNGLLNVANTSAATTGTLARFQSNSTADSGLTILANGNVGIGSTTPTSRLYVKVDESVASTVTGIESYVIHRSSPTTGATGIRAGAIQRSAASTASDYVGGDLYAITSASNGGASVGGLIGSRSYAAHVYNSGSVTNLIGASNNASIVAIGGSAVTNAIGTKSFIDSAFGGTISDARGGFFEVNSSGAMTVTNAYGIYTGNVKGTNKWSLYASDAAAPSYFAGNVGIGATVPASALDVNGALTERGISAATAGLSPAGQGRIYFDSTSNTFKASQNGGAYVDLVGGGAASSVAASAGTAGSPSVSFSGDADTGFYSKAANTIGISVGTSNVFDISSLGMVSTTTGGANITTAAGTAAAPTYSFAGDAGTGWWRPAASEMAASTGGVERMRIDSNGNLGIATTPVANQRITVSETSTATSGSIYQYKGSLVANPGAASTAGYTGIRMSTGHNAGFSGGSLQGFYNQVYKNNGGISITSMTGTTVDSQLNDGTATTVTGTKNDLTSSFGVATTVTAAENNITYSTGATTMYGTKSSIMQNAGTTATAYGNYSTVTKTAGTITNSYGVYIDSVQGTNKWSLYANDSAAPSYFAGNVGIGATVPTAKLQVDGTNAVTGSFSNTGTNNPSSAISAWSSGAALANVGGSFAATGGTSNKAIEISLTPAAANNYAIYSGSAAQSFFSGNVGIGTTAPARLLHVAGPMRITASALPGTPATGDVAVDSADSNKLKYYDGTTWQTAGGGSVGATLTGITSIANAAGDITLAPVAATGAVLVTSGAASTASNNGALVVTGGAGVSGAINAGGNIYSGANITANTAMYSPLIYGGTTASANLTLDSTSHATKGYVLLAPTGGNVGIGTATPTSALQVNGEARIGTLNFGTGADITGDEKVRLVNTPTTSNSNFNIFNLMSFWAPGSNGGTANGIMISSAFGYNSNNNNLGSGTSVLAGFSKSGTGNLTKATGLDAAIDWAGGAGTDVAAGRFAVTTTGGTITNGYGVKIGTVAGTTNKWSLHANDATAPSYFAGKVGIGTAAPNSKLDVVGGAVTVDYSSISNMTAGTFTNSVVTTSVASSPGLVVSNYENTANTIAGLNFKHANASFAATDSASIQASLSTLTAGAEQGFMRFATMKAGTLTEQMRIDNNGNVGIGNAAPAYPLDIVTTSTAATGTIGGQSILVTHSPTADSTAAAVYGSQVVATTAASQNVGALVGSYSSANYSASTMANTAPIVYGGYFSANAAGAGTYGDVEGVGASVTMSNTGAGSGYGVKSAISITGAGTFNTGSGGNFTATLNSAGATLSNGYGVRGQVTGTAGTITNAHGLYSMVNKTAGTITNGYGLYINSVQATNKWSVYASDTTAPSYFAGSVGIGSGASVPTATLDVKGHVANTGAAATVGSCGTGPTISGNDNRGAVTNGTGAVSSCEVTFNAAYTTAPFCVVSWNGTGAPTTGLSSVATTTTLTVYFSASSPSAVFNYQCTQ